MSVFKLHDYQQEALETVQAEFKAGTTKQLICLPTGSGKTIIMAAVAKAFNKKTLILAHREELIQQAKKKLPKYWKKAKIGIVKASLNELDQQVVVGSVSTCSKPKRLAQLKQQGFELLMIDEAHHATANTYQRIINELGFNTDKSKLLIGVTATPERSDNQGLLTIFERIVFLRSISTMIKDEYLSNVIGRQILTSSSLSGVASFNGDFAAGSLSNAINTPSRNKLIVDKFKEHAENRKAIAFCSDVKHAQDLAQVFQNNGIKAEAVWGSMPPKQRSKVLRDLKVGKIAIVTSCGVLTEGFDEPSISCILMARPTKSKPFYIQMVGRGLRLHQGKENCLVLDFTDTGNNLNSIISLCKAIPDAQEIKEPPKEPIRTNFNDTTQKEIDHMFDILGHISFLWVQIDEREWSLTDDNGNEIIVRPAGDHFMASIFYKNGAMQSIVRSPISLKYCVQICEDYAQRYLSIKFADANATWMQNTEPPTQPQLNLINSKGWSYPIESKAQASLVIRKIIAIENRNRRLQKEMR